VYDSVVVATTTELPIQYAVHLASTSLAASRYSTYRSNTSSLANATRRVDPQDVPYAYTYEEFRSGVPENQLDPEAARQCQRILSILPPHLPVTLQITVDANPAIPVQALEIIAALQQPGRRLTRDLPTVYRQFVIERGFYHGSFEIALHFYNLLLLYLWELDGISIPEQTLRLESPTAQSIFGSAHNFPATFWLNARRDLYNILAQWQRLHPSDGPCVQDALLARWICWLINPSWPAAQRLEQVRTRFGLDKEAFSAAESVLADWTSRASHLGSSTVATSARSAPVTATTQSAPEAPDHSSSSSESESDSNAPASGGGSPQVRDRILALPPTAMGDMYRDVSSFATIVIGGIRHFVGPFVTPVVSTIDGLLLQGQPPTLAAFTAAIADLDARHPHEVSTMTRLRQGAVTNSVDDHEARARANAYAYSRSLCEAFCPCSVRTVQSTGSPGLYAYYLHCPTSYRRCCPSGS
jgi:hypothetical protein